MIVASKTKRVCVIGGTGFVGTVLCRQLLEKNYQVTVLSRRHLASSLDNMCYQVIPSYNVENLQKIFQQGYDAVIFLSGILHEQKKESFEDVHVSLPAMIVEACQTVGISRYLHMSALCARFDAPSAYLRSKGCGEEIVRHTELEYTIFRPSVIFGEGDSFLTLFAKVLKFLPVVLLAAPDARFQPVYVEDVAQAFVTSLERPETIKQTYDLGGNKIYTLKELVKYVGDIIQRPRFIIGLNPTFSYLQAWLMEFSPIKLMTRDNFYSMQIENTCGINGLEKLGIHITDLEKIAPNYLK